MRDKMSHAIPDIISWDGMIIAGCYGTHGTKNDALWEFQNLRENLQETWENLRNTPSKADTLAFYGACAH